jgi:hypothetical protein
MRRTLALATLVVGLAAGCQGDSLPSPTGFTAVQLSFDNVQLDWTPPSAPVDGTRSRDDPGQRLDLHRVGLVPADVAGATLSIDPSAPERIDIGFRIRSAKGASRSGWVTTNFRRGIRGPATLTVSPTEPSTGIRLPPVIASWQNASQVATELRLERAPLEPGTGATAFVPIPDAVFPASSFSDQEVSEGSWQYRISYGTQGEWSLPRSPTR